MLKLQTTLRKYADSSDSSDQIAAPKSTPRIQNARAGAGREAAKVGTHQIPDIHDIVAEMPAQARSHERGRNKVSALMCTLAL